MIILIGESGSGKSTVERQMCEKYGFERALSCTTRAMREGEADGIDYNFVSVDEFMRMKENNELLESVEFNGNYYGLHKNNVRNDVIAVVEPSGMRQLKALDDIDAISIYLRSPEELREKRMLARGDKPEDVQKRIENDREHFKGLVDMVDCIVDISEDDDIDTVVGKVLAVLKNVGISGQTETGGVEQDEKAILDTLFDSDNQKGITKLKKLTHKNSKLNILLTALACTLVFALAFVLTIKHDTSSVLEYSLTQDFAQPSGLVYPQEPSDIEERTKVDFEIRDTETGGIPARGYKLEPGFYYFECDNGATIFLKSKKEPSQWDYAYQIIGNVAIKIVDPETLLIEELPDKVIELTEPAIIQTTGETHIISSTDKVRLESKLTIYFPERSITTEEELERADEERGDLTRK